MKLPDLGLKEILVFVSSPGDVQAERKEVDVVVDELNRGIARDKGFVLRALLWERDSIPAGVPSQEAIDSQLPEYHIYIGILWRRFGTPTATASSGTESEFRDAFHSFKTKGSPWIMFYFCERPFYSAKRDDLEQFTKVVKFRDEVTRKIHSRPFVETADFVNELRFHLTSLILNHLAASPAHPPAAAAAPGWDTRVLATTELAPVGRQDEIGRIIAALRDGTSFVITGIGGIGKSTVLDAALRALPDPRFTHLASHRITEEGGVDERLRHLLSKLLVSLQAEVQSSELADLFAQVRALLPGKTVLFAIDNADDEHSQRVVRRVRDELPTLTLAVTSTQRRWDRIVTIELEAMRPSNAAELYRRIRGDRQDDDEQTLMRLCEALQCHPMVVMQVAVDARERNASAKEMLDRELRLGRDLTSRFDAARARLSPAGRRALAVIGQLAKVNVRIDLVKAVASADDEDLRSLEDQCLARINSASGHLSVHRLAHAWCRARVGAERAEYLDAIATFYCRFLTQRQGLEAVDIRELDEEWENILGVLDSDLEPLALAHLVDCTIVDHFDEPEGYVFTRRKTSFLVQRSDRIEGFARQAGGEIAARLEKNLGHIFYLHGNTVKAQSLFMRARERYLRANDQVGVAATMWLLGYVADDENRYRDAEDLYRDGTKQAHESGNPDTDLLAVGHHLIGSTRLHQGDLKEAERQFRIAREYLSPTSRPSVRSRVLRRLGSVLVRAGHLDDARGFLAGALRLAHAHEHNRDIARTTRQVGRLHLAKGALHKAERQLQRSYDRFQLLRSRREFGGVLRDTAELRRLQGRCAEARTLVETSIAIAREFNSLFGEAAGHELLAEIEKDEGRSAEDIARRLDRAKNIYSIIGHPRARDLTAALQTSRAIEPALPRDLRGVMFDLMETLAYIPEELYARRRQALAGALGVDTVALLAAWDETRLQAWVGVLENAQQRIAEVARRLGVRVSPAVVAEEAQFEEAMWTDSIRLYPDTVDLLNAVTAKGLRVAIVTNGPLMLSPLKDRLGLTRYLQPDAFFLSSEFGEMKPDHTLYKRALAHLRLRPEECAFVGDGADRELDDGAMALGLYAIRVTHPGRRPAYVNIKRTSRDWNLEVESLTQLSGILTGVGV
jgi:HAD superfamily hydrolase (TIGR01509 family)